MPPTLRIYPRLSPRALGQGETKKDRQYTPEGKASRGPGARGESRGQMRHFNGMPISTNQPLLTLQNSVFESDFELEPPFV